MVCPHCLERAASYPKGKPDIRKNFRIIQSIENNLKKSLIGAFFIAFFLKKFHFSSRRDAIERLSKTDGFLLC